VRDAEVALAEALASRADSAGEPRPAERAVETAQIGDEVRLQSGARGEVVERTRDGKTVIALGSMHISVDAGEITEVLGRRVTHIASFVRPSAAPEVTARIDLRGARVEDALITLESRIDAVLLAGGDQIEIIHGVGTGALRDAVRKRLRDLPGVREVKEADAPWRDGVTIALF
jgi:DNA mismatch repair protein MutS2